MTKTRTDLVRLVLRTKTYCRITRPVMTHGVLSEGRVFLGAHAGTLRHVEARRHRHGVRVYVHVHLGKAPVYSTRAGTQLYIVTVLYCA